MNVLLVVMIVLLIMMNVQLIKMNVQLVMIDVRLIMMNVLLVVMNVLLIMMIVQLVLMNVLLLIMMDFRLIIKSESPGGGATGATSFVEHWLTLLCTCRLMLYIVLIAWMLHAPILISDTQVIIYLRGVVST